MKKTTKGALAAGSAAVLLMGGAGTLAFWTDSVTAEGTDIQSGHLSLDLDSCDGWTLDGGAAYTTQLLVPGDTLTQNCTYTLDIAGEHLRQVDFDVTLPSDVTGAAALIDEIGVTAGVTLNGTPQADATNVAVTDGDTVAVAIEIAWPYGVEDNDSNVVGGLAAALNDITVTVTQNHDA
jgi:alternate signal-mediated exported protein